MWDRKKSSEENNLRGNRVEAFLSSVNGASWFQTWGIPLLIFVTAFLIRAIYPVSRSINWSDRAFHFANAIFHQDWSTTYQQYHPGVTLMWLSGPALQLFSSIQGGLSPEQLLGIEPTKPGILSQSVVAGVVPLAFVIAFCIALTYPLLSRLAGRSVALISAIFIVFDPFYVEYSKVIHPDALLTSFMLISLLALMVYLKERRKRWLILSGIFAGLGLLSKTPSIFLIFYTTLLVSITSFYELAAVEHHLGWHQIRGAIWKTIRVMVFWSLIAAAVFFILWPAMWVEPFDVLNRMFNGILYHGTEPHMHPIFFAGEIYTEDPGPQYYLATIIWKTTAVTLPLILVGFIFAMIKIRSPKAKVFWALSAYIFFFTVQMTLGEFKQMAYILPTFPILNILAAFGLVWLAEALGNIRYFRGKEWVPILLVVIALAAQPILVLDHFPYFGTHFNNLLGGSRIAQKILPLQHNGEGLDLAARYLSQLPHGQDDTAILFEQGSIVFRREFSGRTMTEVVPWASYRIYYINQIMRGLGGDTWERLWLQDQASEPLMTVDFDGVTYVWVYGKIPEDQTQIANDLLVDYRLGEQIRLTKINFDKEPLSPGETLTVEYTWRLDSEIDKDFTVFTHLLSSTGELVAQQDNVPLSGIRPTATWRVDEELEDVHQLSTSEDIEPGQYEIYVGMYDSEDLQRLPTFNQLGEQQKDDKIVIGIITIE